MYIVGLAKIFGEKSARPHGGNWGKTLSSRSDFYHATRALKEQDIVAYHL